MKLKCGIRLHRLTSRTISSKQIFADVETKGIRVENGIGHKCLPRVDGADKVASLPAPQFGAHATSSLLYRLLKKCMAQKDLVLGRYVHDLVVKNGYETDTFLGNHIIRMYASHGWLEEATQVFTKLPAPNTFVWASIISAHAEHSQPTLAIQLYREMRSSTLKPNNHIFVAVLKACATSMDLASGKDVHADIINSEVKPDIFVANCLVHMYAKCGSLVDARKVFDNQLTRDVVSWNGMLTGYAQQGFGQEALKLYGSMRQEGISPNHITYTSLLKACASVQDLQKGREMHAQILERELIGDVVLGNCLVDMYSKCCRIDDARAVFDNMQIKDVVTWNVMIAAYEQQGMGQEALVLYSDMLYEGSTSPDRVTFMSLLQVCASIGALHHGKKIHTQIQDRGLHLDAGLGNCLVDMYAKCGSLDDAHRLLRTLPSRDVVTWTALLNGYAQHNNSQMAMHCFEEMRQQGVKPDGATFVCLLVACSHEGLVDKGNGYLQMMMDDYDLAPTIHHYNCMVDLFGRSGRLEEAEEMLQTMPCQKDVVGWTSLLNACKSHGDLERGIRCFNRLIELEPENSVSYVLLGNMYAKAGRWSDVGRMERLRISAGAWKKPARAWTEVASKVRAFTVGEESADVSSKLRSVKVFLEKLGPHVPQTELVVERLTQQEKEDALCGHAEKLALAYGLLNTPDGTTLQVTKNLRMCNDCHSSTKVVSRLEKREIIVRDAHRVHRFIDGFCSCGDRC